MALTDIIQNQKLNTGAPDLLLNTSSKPKEEPMLMAGPDWYQKRLEVLMDMGYGYEEAGDIAFDSKKYYEVVGEEMDDAGYEPGDYASGGSVRQNYGLGSFVKKAIKKVTSPVTKVAKKLVPKEIAGIMRVAAPFLPAGYREAAYLLGTAKQTGRISPMDLALTALPYANKALGSQKSLPLMERKGFFAEKLPGANKFLFGSPEQTLGGTLKNQVTQDATTGIFGSGGKMFQFGKGAGFADFRDQTKLGSLLLGDGDGGFSKAKVAGLGLGTLSLIQNAKTPEEAGELLVSQTGNTDDYDRGYALFSRIPEGAFDIPQQYRLANGGMPRSNYAMGGEPLPEDPTKPVNPFQPKPTGPVLPNKMANIPEDLTLEKAIETFRMLFERDPKNMQELIDFYKNRKLSEADSEEGIMMAKNGGFMRKNFALGTRPTAQESGLGGLPIEADMRYTGGFMPYGAAEKADDVPARLSKNEFVFTADSVKAAGGGSIQKGAQRMYNTMKQLEAQHKGMA